MLGIWVATYRWAGRLRRLLGPASQAGILAQSIQASIVVVLVFSLTEHEMGMGLSPLTVFTMVGLLQNAASYEARRAVSRVYSAARATPVAQPGALTFRPQEAR